MIATIMDVDKQEYQVETRTYHVGMQAYQLRTLLDRRQYSDPDGSAERAGISSAAWPMFGMIWPAGIALADEMSRFPIAGKRILEVGCGIGLPSMVLQQRGANITASDWHPLAEEFLRHNTDLNGLAPIHFSNASWLGPNPHLGRFDLIIGSDLLYERDHPELLAGFLASHANPACHILLTDPGRTNCSPFSTYMEAQGYTRTEARFNLNKSLAPCPRGRFMSFVRTHA